MEKREKKSNANIGLREEMNGRERERLQKLWVVVRSLSKIQRKLN
jgi:hypothetical protein